MPLIDRLQRLVSPTLDLINAVRSEVFSERKPVQTHASALNRTCRAGSQSRVRAAHRVRIPGRPVWTPRDYSAFAREGVMQNAIVYRSVRMVAECVATIPLIAYHDDHEIEHHPLLDLIARPAPGMTCTDLLEQFVGFLLVSGNGYLEAVGDDGNLIGLAALRPDRMKVIPGHDGWPEGCLIRTRRTQDDPVR